MAHCRVARWAALFLLVLPLLVGGVAEPAEAMLHETMTLITAQGERTIKVEITENDSERARGLMFRTQLADTAGMLFFYDRPQDISMWMKNTYIPLDMVFIRADGTVHRIEAYTEPFSLATIDSQGNVVACLELAGGAAARLGLKPGDRIVHRYFKPAAR